MGRSDDAVTAKFIEKAIEQTSDKRPEVAVFEAVRDLPYATDSAHNLEDLLQTERGDCLAKSELLYECFKKLGLDCRLVRWRYQMPNYPPEVNLLPTRLDIHRAVEVRIGDQWLLVDATHDPPLSGLGLRVNNWGGIESTLPTYEPKRPLLIEGQHDDQIEEELARIAEKFEGTPKEVTKRYRRAFNDWLDTARNQ